MNDVIDVSPAAPKDGLDPERDSSLRTIGHISYGLHAVVAVSAVLLVGGYLLIPVLSAASAAAAGALF